MKSLSKFISVFFAALFCFAGICVSAESSVDVSDNSYIYWETGGTKTAKKTKPIYGVRKSISGADIMGTEFKSLDYIYAYGNNIYILDSEAASIYVLDTDYRLTNTISSLVYNNETVTFDGAKGLFVDESGIYIADTQNGRIICSDGEKVSRIITRPDSAAIPETFTFSPNRLIRDKSGYIYTLCDGSYYGLMVFDGDCNFLGFYGANQVESTFMDALKGIVTSLFETEEKHNASVQALPYQMVDACIDKNGFICTVNSNKTGQLKRFGPSGTNILVRQNQFDSEGADSFNFGDQPYEYLDVTNQYGKYVYITQSIDSLATDSQGFYYLADSVRGKLFIYDVNCKLLGAFGGGEGKGEQAGSFTSPTALAVLNDDLIVADYSTGRITVMAPTEYGRNLKTACALDNSSEYVKAKPYWKAVLNSDKNNRLAYIGLAKAALEENDYDLSMQLSKLGGDRVTYAHAFEKKKNIFTEANFWWMAALAVSAACGLVWLLLISKKRRIVFIKNEKLSIALSTAVHPFVAFNKIKQQKGSTLIATVFLILFYVAKVVSQLHGGFMYGSVDTDNFNAVFTLIGSVGAVLLWVAANWLVCILFDGKGRLKEIYHATCYSLMPLIVYYLLYLLLSHFIVPSANGMFGMMSTLFDIFFIIIILLSVTVIHEFSFFKSIGTSIVSVLGMCIVAFVLFLMLTLFQDLLGFILGIINEASLR